MKHFLSSLLFLSLLLSAACVDLKFDEPPVGGEPVNIIPNSTIEELKSRFVPGQFTTIEDSLVIRAIVIADDASGQYYKTIVVQDETAGIEVKVNSIGIFNEFPIGREVFIFCKGLVISDYNGLIQIGGGTYLDNGETRLGGIEEVLINKYLVAGLRNQNITPAVKAINAVTSADLSTLIQLVDVQFADGSANETYADPVTQFSVNRTVEDCTNKSIVLRSSGYADFAGIRTPGGKGTLTAVLSIFGSTYQLAIRDTSDVQMIDDRCGQVPNDGLESLTENFETVGDGKDVALNGWVNNAQKGTRLWRGKTFSGNTYVQATAFGDTGAEMEAWLITPAINLTVPKTLNFKSSVSFWVHNPATLLISTNFNGVNPATATWIPLTATLPDASTTNFAWVDSGTIDLSGFTGKGYIAFKYNGSGPGGQTTTFILDDVVIKNK